MVLTDVVDLKWWAKNKTAGQDKIVPAGRSIQIHSVWTSGGALGEVSQLVKRLVMISWVRVDVVAMALVKMAGGIVGNSVVMAMGMVAAIRRPV